MSSAAGAIKVSPQTIPGSLHQQNQTAFDWGRQGLVAYAAHNTVVVIDPRSIQPLQTLSAHKTNIIKLRWSTECHHHTLASPYSLRLASVDTTSHCIVWDVNQGAVSAEFSLGTKPLVDLQWLHTNDSCRDLLAVMLTPSSITIWNASTGTKVSRFTFTETIAAFVFNPFQPENLVLLSPECFIFVNDFNPSRNPSGGGKKFYLSTGESSHPPLPGRGKSPPWLQRKLLSSDQLKGEETIPLAECIQVAFSQSNRHHLFIVYPKEVVIMDVEIKQTVGVVNIERNASPFLHLMPCRQRDLLYCLHENGCVSVRVQQPLQLPTAIPMSPFDTKPREVRYDLHGHSEPLRISKTCQVFTGAVCPTSEKRVAVLTSEGRILFWDIEFDKVGVYGEDLPKEMDSFPTLLTSRPLKGSTLVNVTQDEGIDGGVADGRGLTLADSIAPHWFTPPEGSVSMFGLVSLKLILGGLWSSISSAPTVLRMCPPLTTKNWLYYAPLVAVGTSNGSVLIFNLSKRVLYKELAVHSCTIHGIEWISQTSFASYAYTSPSSAGHVRNEIAITDIQAGKVTHLKRPDESESNGHTPIDTIKISLHKNYMVVKYKDRPLEFWDVRSHAFLRELVSNPPTFSCVEWSPSPKQPKAQKTNTTDLLTFGASVSTVDFDVAMGAAEHKSTQATGRELLTVMDETGCMWQISIEGSKVRVVNGQPTQTWLNNPMCVTWKSELMVAGDTEGVLIVFDTKTSQARTIETPKAPVKKIRFAPGKGNTKIFVLYSSRFDIREIGGDEGMIAQLKWGGREAAGSHLMVEDADWATSDKPVLLTSDGCIRVFDIKLQHSQSVITIADFAEPVFCPHVVPPSAAFRLKVMCQHQPWRLEYNLDPTDLSETDPVEKFVRAQIEVMPDEYRVALEESQLGTAGRCLLTANLFGDDQEVAFWTVALYYMLREKNRLQDPRYMVYKYAHRRNPSSDIIRPDSEASISIGSKTLSSSSKPGQSLEDLLGPVNSDPGIDSDGDSLPLSPTASLVLPANFDPNGKDIDGVLQEADIRMLVDTPPLDLNWDLLCDATTFKRMQLDRAFLHDSKRQTYDQTRKCAETLLLLGQTDRAVQLLLETDSSNPDYYTDALKACLAATIRSSGASQSTIKLVATNLIANSMLLEGVQLLCLIDKGQDACRYLQTYGEWHHSVWLAKSTLDERDVAEVFSRWADHLTSVGVNQKSKALLVMLSLGKFYKVIEMLYSMRHFDQAAVFTESCLEYKLVRKTEDTAPLIEAVFLEYARYLSSLGWTRGVRYYCDKAGENGEKLFQQLHKPTT